MPEGYISFEGIYRPWRYPDEQRGPSFSACFDCAKPYGTFGDLVLSNEIWEQINPSNYKGAGLLCPNCIMERLSVVEYPGAGVLATLFAPMREPA